MASAFREPIAIMAHRIGNPQIVYLFGSANTAATFTKADVKSIMQVARGQRKSALSWNFYMQASIGSQVIVCAASKVVIPMGVTVE